MSYFIERGFFSSFANKINW